MLFSFVFHFFKKMNQKAERNVKDWYGKLETFEHVTSFISVYKWVVLPASILFVGAAFFFFGQNVLLHVLWGQLLFVYSTFLPDLPAVYRRQSREGRDPTELPWYKTYSLLLLAPFFLGVLLVGIRLGWRITENFHNIRSLIIYGAFLSVCGLLTFGAFPISMREVLNILAIPVYGMAGYITHLKVDLCLEW